jgi:hypothetical protein
LYEGQTSPQLQVASDVTAKKAAARKKIALIEEGMIATGTFNYKIYLLYICK